MATPKQLFDMTRAAKAQATKDGYDPDFNPTAFNAAVDQNIAAAHAARDKKKGRHRPSQDTQRWAAYCR